MGERALRVMILALVGLLWSVLPGPFLFGPEIASGLAVGCGIVAGVSLTVFAITLVWSW